eukprot:m.114075 g.114075  ORF g.114075 m.114075 type:complete len:786 (+) comp14153_c0_seq3:1118-3475(+)
MATEAKQEVVDKKNTLEEKVSKSEVIKRKVVEESDNIKKKREGKKKKKYEGPPPACPLCGKEFSAWTHYNYHWKQKVCQRPPKHHLQASINQGASAPKSHPENEKITDGAGEAVDLPQVFNCPHCGKAFHSEPGMLYHVEKKVCEKKKERELKKMEKRKQIEIRKAEAAKTKKMKIEEEERKRLAKEIPYEYSLLDADDQKRIRKKPKPKITNVFIPNDKKYLSAVELESAVLERNKLFWKHELFPSWRPKEHEINILANAAASHYIEYKESLRLKVSIDKKDANDMKLFDARVECEKDMDSGSKANLSLFFPGPCVQHLECCPRPPEDEGDDLLAVVTIQDGIPHLLYDVDHKKDCVQFWCLPSSTSHAAMQKFTLATDFGFIRKLVWCPSGCWDDPKRKQTQKLARSGLLAVAGSNLVRVYAIPHDPVNGVTKENKELLVLQQSPCFQLINGASPVVDVCWSLDEEHSRIAIGYTDGSFAVFDLVEYINDIKEGPSKEAPQWTSLRKRETIESINPCFVIQSEACPISSIQFCPEDTSLLAVVGHGETLQFWNVDDAAIVDQFYCFPNRKPYRKTELLWPCSTAGPIVGSEDHRLILTLIPETGLPEFSTVFRAASPLRSIDFSHWKGLVTGGCSQGMVLCKTSPDPMDQGFPRPETKGENCFQTLEIQSRQINGEPLDWTHFTHADCPYIWPEEQFIDVKTKDFVPYTPAKSRPKAGKPAHKPTQTQRGPLPIPSTAISKVRWSPNKSSSDLLITASASGLVVLQRTRLQFRPEDITDSFEK